MLRDSEFGAALRFWVFAPLLAVWTAVLGAAATFVLLLPSAYALRVARLWSVGALGLLAALGVRGRIRGRQRLPKGKYILASLHQSAWETIALQSIIGNPRYLLKRSLLWIPLFGLYLLKLRMISIDRSRPTAALRKLLRAADTSRPVVIFPAGTRTPPDAEPNTLKEGGVWAIYNRLGVAVVPCVLNSGRFWPPGRWRLYAGTVKLTFLPPLAPGLSRDEFGRRLRAALRAEP